MFKVKFTLVAAVLSVYVYAQPNGLPPVPPRLITILPNVTQQANKLVNDLLNDLDGDNPNAKKLVTDLVEDLLRIVQNTLDDVISSNSEVFKSTENTTAAPSMEPCLLGGVNGLLDLAIPQLLQTVNCVPLNQMLIQ